MRRNYIHKKKPSQTVESNWYGDSCGLEIERMQKKNDTEKILNLFFHFNFF